MLWTKLLPAASALCMLGCDDVWGIHDLSLARFCEAHAAAALCLDFDDGAPLPPSGWSLSPGDLGRGALDEATFVSAPLALRITAPPVATNGGHADGWSLAARLPPWARRVAFSFDARLDAIDPKDAQRYVQLADLGFDGGGPDAFKLLVGVGADGVHLNEETDLPSVQSIDRGAVQGAFAIGAWNRVELDFTLDPGTRAGGVARLVVNGAPLVLPTAQGSADLDVTSAQAFGPMNVRFGAVNLIEPELATTLGFDDVLVAIE